ncbi:hypothetical protein GCM10028820_22130 [Tessaracoccus terricola]
MIADRSKDSLRLAMVAARSRLSAAQWAGADAARTAALLAALPVDAAVVALYASRPAEPGTAGLLEALLAQGREVLLPKLRRSPDWARFGGAAELVPGWAGIPHPPGPALGPAALGRADVAVVPCLAVGRDGSRLGTGGGWYDRALPHRREGVPVWALARADEVLDGVPTLPHDIPVDAVVTEAGFEALGGGLRPSPPPGWWPTGPTPPA